MWAAGKFRKFLFCSANSSTGSVAGVNIRIIGKNKQLLRNAVDDQLKGSGISGMTGTSGKKSISDK